MNYSTQSDEKKKEVLRNSKTIAVVGASNDPFTASFRISKYLKEKGYKIIPVNPNYQKILDEKCYPDLKSIPETVDLVDVFRRGDEILGVIEEAASLGIPGVWLQSGLFSDPGHVVADKAGMDLIENCCIMSEHRRLMSEPIA